MSLVVALLVLTPRPALHAQSLVRGELQGAVTTGSDTPLPEAEVGATSERSGLTRFATTERDGSFKITGLSAGEYTVRFEALGHRPVVYVGVPVRPGRLLDFNVTLQTTSPPVESVDTVAFTERAGVRMSDDGGRWFQGTELAGTPDIFPGLAQVSALSSGWDSYGGSQGLPGRLSRIYVDGLPFTPAVHPFRTGDPMALAGLPRRGMGQVSLLQSASDVEWSGSPGGYTSVGTRTSGGELGGDLSGYGALDHHWYSEVFDGIRPEAISYWGGGSADLPVAGDSSRVFVAAEATSVKTPRWLGVDGPLRSAISSGLGGSGLDRNWDQDLESYSGLARLDWALESGSDVMARVNVSRTKEEGSRFFSSPVGYGHPPAFLATDISSLVAVNAPVGDRFLLEVRGGFERSERAFGDEAEAELGSVSPPTQIVEDRVLVGAAPGSDGRVLRTGFLGGPIVHLDLGAHRFKGGVDVSIPSYEYDFAPSLEGEFFFSSPEELRNGEGVFAAPVGGGGSTSFTVPRLAGFLQYRWLPVPELTLTSGIRWDQEFLPEDRISFNDEWSELTGLDNTDIPGSAGSWGGRLGVRWDLAGRGSTLIGGSVEAHSGRIDPALLHEVILLDGPVDVRRVTGSLGSWPEAPDPAVGEEAAPMLALLDPDVRQPLTTRASLSLSQSLGFGTTVRFSGTYRRTEYLSRRRDLNRVLLPVAGSNLDRPVYGELDKVGSVVQAVPGSNRRFEDFDRVWALNSDGWSEYTAASVAVEHSWGVLDGFAEYTFSRTEDNWVGAAAGLPDASLGPGLSAAGPGSAGPAWEEGVSDFDLPHRLAAGLEATFAPPLLESVTLGSTFRLQSGYPFTPSYPAGSDVNGDGSSLNDPAFVPDDPAVRDLAGEWDCLDAWIGQVVERNACRAPLVYTLDFRIHLTLVEWSGGSAELLLEGFNLLDARTGPRDGALLLVDPDAPITGQGTGTLEIPTVVNPEFGELLFPAGSGRRARAGIRVGLP